jgi:hypothetical protein
MAGSPALVPPAPHVASLVFVETTPDAVVLALGEGVLKARGTHDAHTAQALGGVRGPAWTWEENAQVCTFAGSLSLPFSRCSGDRAS